MISANDLFTIIFDFYFKNLFCHSQTGLQSSLLSGLRSNWDTLSSLSLLRAYRSDERSYFKLALAFGFGCPHVLVFILIMIGNEISRGYLQGQVIGASIMGTVLVFVLALFIAFVPLITNFILSGVGISGAGGAVASIAAIGSGFVMSLPKKTFQTALFIASGSTSPLMKYAKAFKDGLVKSFSSPQGSSKKNPFFFKGSNSSKEKMDLKKLPGEKGGVMISEANKSLSSTDKEWNTFAKSRHRFRDVKTPSRVQNRPKFSLDDRPMSRPSRPSQSFRSPSTTSAVKGTTNKGKK